MNPKVTLAVSAALMSMSVHAAAELGSSVNNSFDVNDGPLIAAKAISVNKNGTSRAVKGPRFVPEKGLENKEYIYIVHMENDSVAMYDGGIQGLEATNPHKKFTSIDLSLRASQSLKLDKDAPAVRAYAQHLKTRQTSFMASAKEIAPNAEMVESYQFALNAMAVRMLPSEAEEISKLSGVKFVERDKVYTLDTDTGPTLIGAPNVWDGTATDSGVGAAGEGVIVGIIDSGINTAHPSFADISGDGYDHTNPLGEGVYLGDCAGEFPELCNDKLIGVYSYGVITDNYDDTSVFPPDLPKNGEDYGGHGSHVASTAVGNILFDVPETLPEFNEEESSGIETGFVFDRISGVAPRANVISYQVCFGGTSNAGDTYGDCSGAAIAAGIEDAIQDGVDVINYSISGGGFSWGSATELAYLAARNAGIFVATSAGNGGPGASTTAKHAPWYTAVAAAEHGRTIINDNTIGMFSGGAGDLADISGVSSSEGITASIVYAGDFQNPNDPDGDSAQCLEPFPENTFSGQIVVCDRGSIARVQKASNVSDGGAGGYVLANLDGGADSLNPDVYVIPGIHIDAQGGNALKEWLATGDGHMATINEQFGEQTIVPERVDVLAGFSSKGPGTTISTLTPTITGPGVSIYAAYADQHFGHDGAGPAPSDFNFLNGTSMASPHVAGSAALVKSAQPSWTPDNIRSALTMTASISVKKEDGVTAGDWFDMGSGRVQVDDAVAAGLVMDETAANYELANPNLGGDPRTLNLPSITDNACLGSCTWTRTVTATKDGSWSASGASISGNLGVTVSPATFDLVAGQSQEVSVTIDALSAPADVYSFGLVNFTSANSPDLHWPVSVVASKGDVPQEVSVIAKRDQDSFLVTDIEAVEITDLSAISYGLTKATRVEGSVAQDSDNTSILDDLADGLFIETTVVPDDAKRLIAFISEPTAPDLDLWLVLDRNGDGVPTEDEVVAAAQTVSSSERLDILLPEAGMYWIIVQSWAGSGEDAIDTFNLNYAVVDGEVGNNLMVSGPAAVPALTPFDLRLTWDLADAAEGDMYFGAVDLGTSAEMPGNLALVAVDLERGNDDVNIVAPSLDRLNPGDELEFAVTVDANFTTEDRDYQISITLPDGVSYQGGAESTEAASLLSTDPVVDGNTLTWNITQASLLDAEPTYRVTTNAADAQCSIPFGNGGYVDLASFGVGLNPAIDGDTQTAAFNNRIQFLGTEYSGFVITDDGFITLGTDVGSTPWINQLLPDSDVPNNVIAPFWRDYDVNIDAGSGVTVASTANDGLVIIEWDNMETFITSGGEPIGDRADFQIVIDNDFIEGAPNVIFAYTDMVHNLPTRVPTTIGYENADGTAGLTTHYVESLAPDALRIGSIGDDAVDGTLICFYLQGGLDEPTVLPFTLSVDEDNAGGPIQLMAMSSVDNIPGTVSLASEIFDDVQVEGPPMVTIGGEAEVNLEVIELRELALEGLVVEPNGDEFTMLWTQVSGPAAVIAGNGIPEAKLIAPEVTEDSLVVLELTAVDSNGNESTATANVTIKNNVAPSVTVFAPGIVTEGETITVRALANDPEGDDVTISINGVPGSLFSMEAPATNEDITVTFNIVTSDGLNTVNTTRNVTVLNKKSGSIGWIALLLIPVIWLRRRKMH